jgi:hypothetical protein
MMKNITLALVCIVAIFPVFGQITVTSSDFPEAGDTVMVSISNDFDLDFESTGADNNWDYSLLNFTSQRIYTFFDVGDASITYQLAFNNGWLDPDYKADYYTPYANFVIPTSDLFELPLSNPVNFTKIESDRVEIVGVGVELSGFEIPLKNDPIDLEYALPLNYSDEWVSNSFYEIDLNPVYDGILRRYQERTAEVDGWGTVITPFGDFNCIRTKAVVDFTDSMKIVLGESETWFQLPTPTQIIYSWWANDQKIPVLTVVAQDIFGSETITSVEYKDRDWSDLSIKDNPNETFSVYPNPVQDFLYLNTDKSIESVQVYDAIGHLIIDSFGDQNLYVGDLQDGIYFLHTTINGMTTVNQFIKH